MENDLTLLRLQYEILNVPFTTLANQAGCPASIIKQQAEEGNWQQYWPEPDLEIVRVEGADPEDDQLSSEAELLLERQKRRLAIYNVAKEIHLAQRYLRLETELIEKAANVVAGCEDTKDIRALASVFKDMTAKSLSGAMAALSFGQDEGGLPTVILRDLTGKE